MTKPLPFRRHESRSSDNGIPKFTLSKVKKSKPISIPNLVVRSDVSIEINFACRGLAIRDTIKIKPTTPNMHDVKRCVEQIKDWIRNDQFTVEKYLSILGKVSTKGADILGGISGPCRYKNTVHLLLDDLTEERKKTASATQKNYKTLTNHLKAYFDKNYVINDINHEVLLDFRKNMLAEKSENELGFSTGLGLSVANAQKVFNLLGDVLKRAVNLNIIDRNYADGFKSLLIEQKARRSKEIMELKKLKSKPYTFEEIEKIAKVEHWYVNLMLFGFLTGLSSQELRGLAVEDITECEDGTCTIEVNRCVSEATNPITNGLLKSTKNQHRTRIIPICNTGLQVLKRQLSCITPNVSSEFNVLSSDNQTFEVENLKLLFPNLNKKRINKPITSASAFRFNKHVVELAGVTYRPPNQLRHTFTSSVAKARANKSPELIEGLASMLGHTGTEMIRKHYLTLDEGDQIVTDINETFDNLKIDDEK